MYYALAFIGGVILGAMVMALCAIAKQSDERIDNFYDAMRKEAERRELSTKR